MLCEGVKCVSSALFPPEKGLLVVWRVVLGLVVALLSFCFAVWFVSGADEREQPPCRSCAALYSAEIPTVSLCDIARAPDRFSGKMIRVRSEFRHDAGTIILDDAVGGCERSAFLYAGLDESFAACDGALEELALHSGFGTWYDGSAAVTVVGRFGRIETANSFYTGEVGFTIMCLEHAEQREMDTAASMFYGSLARMYFTIGRVAKFMFSASDKPLDRTVDNDSLTRKTFV